MTRQGIMSLIEDLLVASWPDEVGTINAPFPHMTYEQAMRLYGSDKPDARFDIKVSITIIILSIGTDMPLQTV